MAIVAGPLVVGSPVVTPNTYHDMSNPSALAKSVATPSATTSDVPPDTYHDM
jgi:hypothetical protein